MHRHTDEQRREKILVFVREHPRTTKSKVMEHMGPHGLNMSSIVTTQDLLIELISSGKIIVEKNSPTSRNHYLFFNYKDEFNELTKRIENLLHLTRELTKIVIKPKGRMKPTVFEHKEQLVFHAEVYKIFNQIETKITSQEERDTLNHQMLAVLLEASRIDWFLTTPDELLRELKEIKAVPESLYYKQLDTIIKLNIKYLES